MISHTPLSAVGEDEYLCATPRLLLRGYAHLRIGITAVGEDEYLYATPRLLLRGCVPTSPISNKQYLRRARLAVRVTSCFVRRSWYDFYGGGPISP
jgi:hypothetical protein